MGCQVTE